MVDEPEPLLGLQPLLQRVYQKGRYYLAIAYSQPAIPPLEGSDGDGVAERLKAAREE